MQLRSVACVSTSRRSVAMLCALAMPTRSPTSMAGDCRDSAASDRKRNMRANRGKSEEEECCSK